MFLQKRFRGRTPDRAECKRAIDALLRRGHSWSDIRRALERYAPEEEFEEESIEDSFDVNDDFEVVEEAPVEEETVLVDDQSPIEEESENIEYALEENIEEDANSDLELEKMNELDDKYSKYDFDDDADDEIEELDSSKPQFKKSVDLSKFDNDALSEEELAKKERKAQELAEKKRRIIEGTNFDNSLRKE